MSDPLKLTIIGGMMLTGGWLLLTARRHEAATGDPHCIGCGYNVVNLPSDRCPECGAKLSPDTIAYGPPSRMRWNRFWLGAAFLFIPAGWVVLDFALAIIRGSTIR